jgi:glycosyl transferase, family 25
MSMIGHFERIAVIHLPERRDRYLSIKSELARMGVNIQSSKVQVPDAPRPPEANGFPSRAVHGNFLSHLTILRSALDEGVRDVLVLEDDALFHQSLHRDGLVVALEHEPWDMCFLGHALRTRVLPKGLIRYSLEYGPFTHAHCYAVHQRCLPGLTQYLQTTLDNPAGHPDGGHMYIDGAFNHYRQRNPQLHTIIASPSLCRQKGSPSSIAGARWYERPAVVRAGVQAARSLRDGIWRRITKGIA